MHSCGILYTIGLFVLITMLLLMRVVGSALRRQPVLGAEGLIGEIGQVRSWNANEGMVSVHGEEWAARCAEPLELGESVEIVRVRNRMRLDVRRADGDGER